ncbi:MAG: hypothetical protein AAF662_07225 [Pseudomonadota bacterium]
MYSSPFFILYGATPKILSPDCPEFAAEDFLLADDLAGAFLAAVLVFFAVLVLAAALRGAFAGAFLRGVLDVIAISILFGRC